MSVSVGDIRYFRIKNKSFKGSIQDAMNGEPILLHHHAYTGSTSTPYRLIEIKGDCFVLEELTCATKKSTGKFFTMIETSEPYAFSLTPHT